MSGQGVTQQPTVIYRILNAGMIGILERAVLLPSNCGFRYERGREGGGGRDLVHFKTALTQLTHEARLSLRDFDLSRAANKVIGSRPTRRLHLIIPSGRSARA